ncbi:MAG: VanZ family protein [Burkholderiales bacterium]|nr:VanZ family protein [Burkholderiales bacterium]
MAGRHRSLAVPLALAMVALVAYASLHPFTGWRWPAGSDPATLLTLPWPPWETPLDETLNFLGYLPLGLLIAVAAMRSGWQVHGAVALAVLAPALLSYACEVTQHFLPTRHPSLKDWTMNALGGASGAALAVLLRSTGALGHLQRLRERWFLPRSAGALALLALWPAALLFPTPVPWGLGQIGHRARALLVALLDDVPWAEGATAVLAPLPALQPLSPLSERAAAILGLLSPVLLAYAIVRPGLRRIAMAAGALLLGFLAMTVSTLLNFGPLHALAWLTPAAVVGAGSAAAAALAAAWLPRRLVMALALIALSALLALVQQAPADPYFALTLQAWEQGRWVHFHGLSQWLGWLWPFAAIGWLLARLSTNEGLP